MDSIDKEYDQLVEHLHDCTRKAQSSKTTKRGLSPETLELINQGRAARAAGNQKLTSELVRLCRGAITENLKERRAEVSAGAAEEGKSIRYARRDFANREARMSALRNPNGTSEDQKRRCIWQVQQNKVGRTRCASTTTAGAEPRATGLHAILSALQEERRLDGQTSSQSL